MKKTLLCFLFLLPTIFFAQISPLSGCQTYPIFNLTTRNAELIGNLNPNETTVSYHLSLNDADTNTSPIQDPTAFVSPQSQTVYARINNKGTITTNFFQLIFYPTEQIVALTINPDCNEPRTRIQLVSVLPGASQNFSYSLDYGQTYLANRQFYLEPGDYTILIKDSYNCKTDIPVFVQVKPYIPLKANAIVTEGVNCGDKDIVTITGIGGTSVYTYSFDGTNYSNSNTSSELKAGTQTVYVKDQMGCTASTTVTVNQYKSTLSLTADITPATCSAKGSITIKAQGGKSPYMFSIEGTSYVSNQTSNYVFTNLEPGEYPLSIKDDNGCISNLICVINQYKPLALDIVKKDAICPYSSEGSIQVNVTGGIFPYKYLLRNAAGTALKNQQSSNIFEYLSAGDYTVDVTDGANCSIKSSLIHISQPSPLVVTASIENQTITINATGGNGNYLYQMDSFDRKSNNVFTNVSYGDHEVMAIDEKGCITLLFITVNPPAPLIDGKKEMVLEFKSGQTLGDLVINGQNIKWYSRPGTSPTGKTSKVAIEPSLPLSTVLVDGVTYYASQTINGIESKERLAVTAKLNSSLSTPDFDLTEFQFYPNPVKNILSIKNKTVIENIQIFSVSGQSILFQKVNNTHSEIDLSNLIKGMYILNIKSDGKEKALKFIKE
ncbi:T9SS type A sorting domain-containing protein [Flavobacterium sharifuzzamanii]|uniref:T9SS type A sorting domain-containing protein n=1 Tax=Flavobacterium sharifuzzamanii TaxID=2211133 RepID=UPI000DADF0B1|nr:T9SS type A sorting domain-containing protein [Flavobacterium sharifuzzamanii]KAF2079352.1 T9SS type A sorting domain-containing protein [Flavobacterium sharifuzzamanii]